MKNGIYIILIAIAFGFTAAMADRAQAGAPAAILSEAQYRFGTAIEGDIVRHDFILLNKGNAELRIEKIKTG